MSATRALRLATLLNILVFNKMYSQETVDKMATIIAEFLAAEEKKQYAVS